jgi:hypothetical protein
MIRLWNLQNQVISNILGMKNFGVGSKNRERNKLKHILTYFVPVEK